MNLPLSADQIAELNAPQIADLEDDYASLCRKLSRRHRCDQSQGCEFLRRCAQLGERAFVR
jgi:L-rhamnose isomerase